MLVLGIETSCDETALALVEDGKTVLGTQVASSLRSHQPYGGVVPEIASRAHVEVLTTELEVLFSSCRVTPSQVDRIAVTYGPGLAGSLLMGIAAAKALSLAWGKPLVAVHHLQAHLYAALMGDRAFPLDLPMIGLVISGGHTALIRMDGIHAWRLLGATRDDAVGEAFDKVAKLLNLGFPGGPEIERAAREGDPKAFRFTVPKIKSGSPYDFSLSGIKTAVLLHVQKASGHGTPGQQFVADLAASFQHSLVEEVVAKSMAACLKTRIPRLLVGGGVVANRCLRDRLSGVCGDLKIDLRVPALSLCTDNGAMVGGLGFHLVPGESTCLRAVPNLSL